MSPLKTQTWCERRRLPVLSVCISISVSPLCIWQPPLITSTSATSKISLTQPVSRYSRHDSHFLSSSSCCLRFLLLGRKLLFFFFFQNGCLRRLLLFLLIIRLGGQEQISVAKSKTKCFPRTQEQSYIQQLMVGVIWGECNLIFYVFTTGRPLNAHTQTHSNRIHTLHPSMNIAVTHWTASRTWLYRFFSFFFMIKSLGRNTDYKICMGSGRIMYI